MVSDELRKKGKVIRERCFAAVAGTYPAETAGFLMREQDRFQNPIGYALRRGVDDLFESLFEGAGERVGTRQPFQEVLRILAVQTFSPSTALSFIRFMKEAVRRELADGVEEKDSHDLHIFEAKLDEAMMDAFDLYVEFRERIGMVRINEVRAEKDRLMRLIDAIMRGGDRPKSRSEADKDILP